MYGIQIIEQAVGAIRRQWEDSQGVIIDALQPETPSMEQYVRIMGIEFRCLVENEINGTNILRIEEKSKSCMGTYKGPVILVARYVQPLSMELCVKWNLTLLTRQVTTIYMYTKGYGK